MKKTLYVTVAAAILAAAPQLACAQVAPQEPATRTAPSADQAKNNASDRTLMQQIRKQVMADKSLSTAAHNVKIIATHGTVTLRGNVPSEAEKAAVGEKAAAVAGQSNVVNDLVVKPPKK